MIFYQKNAPLGYKTTCSERESRNFDCQWTLVSFLVKRNQFYREARLTCPLYRSTEDICIGICVFKRVSNVWHILKKRCVNATTFEQFAGKQRRVEWKSVGNFVAKTVLVESANQFLLEELCRTQYSLKYFFRSHVDHQTYGKTLKALLCPYFSRLRMEKTLVWFLWCQWSKAPHRNRFNCRISWQSVCPSVWLCFCWCHIHSAKCWFQIWGLWSWYEQFGPSKNLE